MGEPQRKLTTRQMERALLRLFNEDAPVIPRLHMSDPVYSYVRRLWLRTKRGRDAMRAMRAIKDGDPWVSR